MPTRPENFREYDVADDSAAARLRTSSASRIPDPYPELDHLPPPAPMQIEHPGNGLLSQLALTVPPWLQAGKQFLSGVTELQAKPIPQAAGMVLAGPVVGSSSIPGFRQIAPDDLPWLGSMYTKVGDSSNILFQLDALQSSVTDDIRDVRLGLHDMQTTLGLDMTGFNSTLTILQGLVNTNTLGLGNNAQTFQDALNNLHTDLTSASALASQAWDKSVFAASGVLQNAQDMLDGFANINTALGDQDTARTAAVLGLQGAILQEVSDRQAAILSEVNDRQAALAQEVSDRTLAIVAETADRTSALQAEGRARDLLATQIRGTYTGTDVQNVVTGLIASEKIARSTQYEGLAQQLTLLSAGVSGSFDPGVIWYFTNDAEGWTDTAGGPTYADSWIIPAVGTGVQLIAPAGFSVNGSEYAEVRLRLRKVGAPAWAGQIWWQAASDGSWSGPVDLAEPAYDDNNVGLLAQDMDWTGALSGLKIQLSTAQTATDGFKVDWISVGRASPGASRAELANEIQARATQDTNLATQITVLDASLTSLDGTVGGHSTAINQLQVDNTQQGNNITSNASAITSLQSRMPVGGGNVASASALDSLTTTVSSQGTTLTAHGASLSAIQARLPVGNGSVASADALSNLSSTVSQIDGRTTTNANSLQTVQTNVGALSASVSNEITARTDGDAANASAITALTLRLPSGTGAIATQASLDVVDNKIKAVRSVILDVNNYVIGTSLDNDGTSGAFNVRADKFSISAPGGGARTEFSNGQWRVYDSNGTLRVKLGLL